MQPMRARSATFLALSALLAGAVLPGGASAARIPTVDVTPKLSPGPTYDFHTAGGRIRCNLVVGAHGTAVDCAGPTKSASLLWSGLVTMPASVEDAPGKSRLVRAGTRLRIHVPSDRLVYSCRAFGTAMQCKHSRTGHGFLVGLTVARRV
jgi:hypothetical protein